MTTAILEVDDELERCARFSAEVAGYQVCSRGWTGLESRPVAGWLPAETDLVGRATAEGLMRSAGIVPFSVSSNLLAHRVDAHGHQDTSQGFVLEGAKEGLDDGDGAFVPERTKSWSNAASVAPMD